MRFSSSYGAVATGKACQIDVPWEEYCACKFSRDPDMEARCNSKPGNICPIGICLPGSAPWTDYGADARGIPRIAASLSVAAQKQQAYVQAQAANIEIAQTQSKLLTNIALGIGAFGIAIVIAGSAAALSRKKQ